MRDWIELTSKELKQYLRCPESRDINASLLEAYIDLLDFIDYAGVTKDKGVSKARKTVEKAQKQ